jgi:hypothetical protein
MIFSINNKEVEQFTNRLREMHRSNLPIVVRQTLNDMAFDVKTNTLPNFYKKSFVVRQSKFLKAHTGVKKAEGWDIEKMQSEVGIVDKGSEAAKELSMQEFGGAKRKPFVYMRNARASRANEKLVNRKYYINKNLKITGQPKVSRTRKSNMVAQAIMAQRLNKFVIWDSKSGQTVNMVNSITFKGTGRNRNVKINTSPIADYESNRNIKLSKKPFLLPASKASFAKAEHFFIKNAKKRFEKALK